MSAGQSYGGPPDRMTVYFCPACGRSVRGTYNLDQGRRQCTKTWHRAVPVGVPYARCDNGEVHVALSQQAAAFLVGTVDYMNDVKHLPADNAQALESSAWLEEIAARTRKALGRAAPADQSPENPA